MPPSKLWPRALEAVDPANPDHVGTVILFTEFLPQMNRVTDAVRVWNQLVDRRIIDSGKLDPAAGASIADPDFSFPVFERGFGWRVTHDTAGIAAGKDLSSLRFDFDGNEPEASVLLTTLAPLIPAKAYRLSWKTDTSRLSSRRDAGFVLQVIQEPGNVATECQPMLQSGEDGACQFTSRPDADWAQINVIYRRAVGTIRVQGTFQIDALKLGFGS